MNTQTEFKRILAAQTKVAIATSVNDVTNVRIVNFYYDENSKVLFLATFGDNNKVKEFEQNNNVAFTTIPDKGYEHVKAKGQIYKSTLSIFDVQEIFVSKIPDYKNIIDQAGQFLILFEVKFETATVTLDFENSDTITLV